MHWVQTMRDSLQLIHEDRIWPEASRIKVFMPFPGVEVPHLCAQCDNYPCVESCPVNALSVDQTTSAVLVDRENCISCGKCISGMPWDCPVSSPEDNKATICDLCNGDPECVKVCTEAGYNAFEACRGDVCRRGSCTRSTQRTSPRTWL